MGYTFFIYLDDILLIHPSREGLKRQLETVLQDIEDSGLLLNLAKSNLNPTQELDHLGFHINLKTGQLQVPAPKLKMIRRELGKLLTHPLMTPRKMSSIVGQVRAFLTVFPPRGVYRYPGQIHKQPYYIWMGHSPPPSFNHKRPSQRVRPSFSRMERNESGGGK